MQGERSILDSFPETIDLNQGSDSNNATMDRSATWDNLLNPVESRLSNYALSSGEGHVNCTNPVNHNAYALSGWDHGESSSSANLHNQIDGRDSKIGHAWPSSVAADTQSTDWRIEPHNLLFHESGGSGSSGNYLHRPANISNPGTSRTPLSANIYRGYSCGNSDGWQGRGSGVSQNLYKPGGSETEHFPGFGASSEINHVPSSSSNYLVQNDDGSGSSSSTWGSSCKRKALEGGPGQSSSCGNLSTHPRDDHFGRHSVAANYNASRSLTISSQPTNSLNTNRPGHLNPRTGAGVSAGTSDRFPPASVNDIGESSHRNFGLRAHLGQQESVPPSLSAAGADVRVSSFHNTYYSPRLISTTETSELRSPFSHRMTSNAPNQSHLAPGLARSMVPYPWSGSPSIPGGSSSSSFFLSGERVRDEASIRNSPSNAEHSGLVSAPETRHLVQEPPTWSFAPVNTSSSGNVPSTSQINLGSASRSFPTVWVPHQSPTTAHNQQRSEYSSWSLFPPAEAEPGGQRGHFSSLTSGPSSSEEAAMSMGPRNGAHSQSYSRSNLMEAIDDLSRWRALAAGIEGRHRLVSEIRQVLNAMRRFENLRAEDYMVFDPFVNGVAEMHDRHRDMRLDVDNMSYEELLALEESIGNVNTGLSEETILQLINQRKYEVVKLDTLSNMEPCCICQEEYIAGDGIGTLDCGHEFHTNCIKQWLTVKNLCPICKMTGLGT